MSEIVEKKRYNLLKSGEACCVCKRSRRKFPHLKLFKFPPFDTIFGKIWREKCKIEEETKKLFICSKHFPIEYLGRKRLRAEAIPSLFLEDEEEYDFPPSPKRTCEVEGICNNCEKHLKSLTISNKKYGLLLKKYDKLLKMYKNLKKTKRTFISKKKKKKIYILI